MACFSKVSPLGTALGTAFIHALASGSLLGLAWLCPPYLGPLIACGALESLFVLWRDEERPGALALMSGLAMLWAKALALGYFLVVDPWPAAVCCCYTARFIESSRRLRPKANCSD